MNFPGFENIQQDLLKWEEEMYDELRNCRACPHLCGVNRLEGNSGVCRTDASYPVSSVVMHHGEEPVISGLNGVCNVFFAHCNLQCKFCQNYQISNNQLELQPYRHSIESLLVKILNYLDGGAHAIGFVSPSHVLPQVKVMMKAIKALRSDCVIIYNSNAYDKVSELALLEGLVDIWLPDFKYMDTILGKELSGVPDYPEVAMAALKEMFRQKGTSLVYDPQGLAISGLIIRHLVIPSRVQNSLNILQFLADELSPRVWISLMSQYYPTYRVKDHPEFGRKLLKSEYDEVVERMAALGLDHGWIQEMDSAETYQPDFHQDNPFC